MFGKYKWWLVAALAAVVLVAAGLNFGRAMVDPKESQEYKTAVLKQGEAQAERDGWRSKYRDLESRAGDLDAREESVKSAEASVASREKSVTVQEKAKESRTIREGTWTVGKDIAPGTYKVTSDVTGSCYWGIYVTGTNGEDIVANDIVRGGRPSVSLSAGQDFKTSRCGTWEKE